MAEAVVPKRPGSRDPEILSRTAAQLAPDVVRWFEGYSPDAIVDTLQNALTRSWSLDGYDLAKRLEQDDVCEPDAELVEALDSASSILGDEHRRAIKQWVAANNITLPRKVGDHIKCRHGVGVINELSPELAVYLFRPDGETRFDKGGGIHVTDEEIEAAPAPGVAA